MWLSGLHIPQSYLTALVQVSLYCHAVTGATCYTLKNKVGGIGNNNYEIFYKVNLDFKNIIFSISRKKTFLILF